MYTGDAALEVPSSEGSPDVGVSAGDRDKDSKDGSPSSDDELRDRGEKTREQDPETIDEITNQVSMIFCVGDRLPFLEVVTKTRSGTEL